MNFFPNRIVCARLSRNRGGPREGAREECGGDPSLIRELREALEPNLTCETEQKQAT